VLGERVIAHVEPEFRFSRRRVRAVALEAFVRKDRSDVPIVFELRGRGRRDDGSGKPSSKSRNKSRIKYDEPNDMPTGDEEPDSGSSKPKKGVGESLKGLFGF
jgi:hypothetical protein